MKNKVEMIYCSSCCSLQPSYNKNCRKCCSEVEVWNNRYGFVKPNFVNKELKMGGIKQKIEKFLQELETDFKKEKDDSLTDYQISTLTSYIDTLRVIIE